MSRIASLLLALLLGVTVVPAVGAQGAGRDRVAAELELTDQRIRTAEELVRGLDDPPRASLQAAVDLQSRARSAFEASQLMVAFRLTRDARSQADRVIAEVRGLPNPDRVTAQVERSRDLLDRLEEALGTCTDVRAGRIAAIAQRMQERAEEAVHQGRFLAALQLSAQVRDRAERALRLCNADESRGASAERVLQRTDELLARVKQELRDTAPAAALRDLDQAESIQSEAWREYRADRQAASIRLSLTARSQAHRARRLGMSTSGPRR